MRLLGEEESQQGQDVAVMARRTPPHASWFGTNVGLCGLLALALSHGWTIITVLIVFLLGGFNMVMYSMRGPWLCAVENSDIFIRAVAAPLFFKRTTDATTRPSIALLSASDIRWFGSYSIEIVAEAGGGSPPCLGFVFLTVVMEELGGTPSNLFPLNTGFRETHAIPLMCDYC